MLSWASQAHAFHQPVCQRLSWLHHWSIPHVIPAEPSLLQNEFQILNAKPHKELIGPGCDNILRPDIADLSDHCPVIPLQMLAVWFVNGQVSLAWSRRLQSGTLVIRLQAQWWREVGRVLSPGEHRPSLQTLYCTPHQHGHGSMHLHTSPAPVAQSKPTSVAQLDALSDWRPWGRGFNTRSATFFCGDWSGNIFYGHSLPSADSRRAVVSFWRKNVHNTG